MSPHVDRLTRHDWEGGKQIRVAFKSQERTYIWKDQELFEILSDVPAFTNEEVVTRRLKGKSLNDYSALERLISVGFDRFAVIRKRVSQ